MSAPETAPPVVSLRPVSRANYQAVIALQVRADQQGFVAPNVFSIAEHHFFPGTQIRAIYADETLVGFVMWGLDEVCNPGEMWVWRLMIDAAHQGRGYARAALQQVIAQVRAAGHPALLLSYAPHNTGAARFYARCGFVQTGRIEGGETVVRLDLKAPPAAPADQPQASEEAG